MDISKVTVRELLENKAACDAMNAIDPKILKSPMVKLVKGKTIEEAMELTNKAVVEALDGLPPVKLHCSVLAEEAVQAALRDYYERQGLPVPEKLQPRCSGSCDHCHCPS